MVKPDTGTPQGSILSPMPANIFLHYVLDTWYETTVKSRVRGYCEIVRYADDIFPDKKLSNLQVTMISADAEKIGRAHV